MPVDHSPVTKSSSLPLSVVMSNSEESVILKEIKKLSSQINSNTAMLSEKISSLEEEIKGSVGEAFGKIEGLQTAVANIEEKMSASSATINSNMTHLAEEIAELHYMAYATQLQILKLPQTSPENLLEVFAKLCLGIDIQHPPVPLSVFRLPKNSKKNTSGVVIVKFRNADDRNIVFNKYMINQKRCNTTILGLTTNTRIYMAEAMHYTQRPIFNHAQLLKNNKAIYNVQARNGLTFVKLNNVSKFISITSIEQLNNVVEENMKNKSSNVQSSSKSLNGLFELTNANKGDAADVDVECTEDAIANEFSKDLHGPDSMYKTNSYSSTKSSFGRPLRKKVSQ